MALIISRMSYCTLTQKTLRQVFKLNPNGPGWSLERIQIRMDFVVRDYLLLEISPGCEQHETFHRIAHGAKRQLLEVIYKPLSGKKTLTLEKI